MCRSYGRDLVSISDLLWFINIRLRSDKSLLMWRIVGRDQNLEDRVFFISCYLEKRIEAKVSRGLGSVDRRAHNYTLGIVSRPGG